MRTRITLILLATILAALNSPGVFAQDENEKLTSPILLNHFYFVLDSATYVSIESSSFLRNEFAITEKRTTVRQGGNSYTGLYFYGENTYFEFFNIATEKNNKVGNTGIAFGIEQPNALNALQQLIVGESTKLSPATRELDGNQIPWFFSIGPKGFPSRYGFNTWIMEYHPRFLSEWHPEANSNNQGISRKQILQRYASVLKDIPQQPYMQDVLGITIAANKTVTDSFKELCGIFGYKCSVTGDTTVLEGPDIVLRFVPDTESRHGIQQIILKIRREPQRQTEYRFGSRSVIKFHGNGTATWSF